MSEDQQHVGDPTCAKCKKAKSGACREHAIKKAPRGPGRPANATKLKESLMATYVGVGMAAAPVCGLLGMSSTEQMAVGQAIMLNAEPCADAWMQLAETNDKVRKALESFTEAGGWGTVIIAHASLGMAVYAAIGAARAEDQANIEASAGGE